jgi:hypothetical protein
MTIPRKYRKLFQDSIVVEIPIHETKTADLGAVLKRVCDKRKNAILREFPSLQTKKQSTAQQSDAEALDDEGNQGADDDKAPALKKTKKIRDETLPQRQHYGSVVDYLEAKYVRGVMLGDEIDDNEASDKESVYSEDSWLDDSLLKRDVAEQVLSHETQTKVGLENEDNDEFFVNVGNLEVEENELLNYDPTQDLETSKKPKKRKRSDAGSTKTTPKSDVKSVSSSKKKDPASSSVSQDVVALKKKAEELGAQVKVLFDQLVKDIRACSQDELPRRNRLVKVTIMIPEGKNPGDTLNFANPHVPGQMLKAAVPKGKGAGDKFDVKVPAPVVSEAGDKNKFSREFQELAAEFSSKYDEWCHAEADYHAADPEQKGKFPLKSKKVSKFEEVIKAFPSNLVTPVDEDYMKKIVRRARQNRKKRKEAGDDSVAVASIAANKAATDVKPSPPKTKKPKLDVKSITKVPKHTLMKAVKPVKSDPKQMTSTTLEILLPSMGRVFRQRPLLHEDFQGMTKE